MHGGENRYYRALVGKREGKRALGRTWRRGENNIKVDLGELVWEDVDWIDMMQDRGTWPAIVNVVMNIRSHKMRSFTLRDEAVFPFQEIFCYVDLVSYIGLGISGLSSAL